MNALQGFFFLLFFTVAIIIAKLKKMNMKHEKRTEKKIQSK